MQPRNAVASPRGGGRNRLTRTRTGSGAYAETLAYGTISNRLQTVTRGVDVRSLSYAASGQVANDNRGPTAVYGFTINARGRVAEAQLLGQPVAQYAYNALEQRVLKTIPGAPPTVTAYHYGPDGLLLAESAGGGSPIREYVWLGDLLVAQIEAAGPALYFAHADHLGTPDKLTDGTKAIVWDAALPLGRGGAAERGADGQPAPVGQYFDQESGLHQNLRRDALLISSWQPGRIQS